MLTGSRFVSEEEVNFAVNCGDIERNPHNFEKVTDYY